MTELVNKPILDKLEKLRSIGLLKFGRVSFDNVTSWISDYVTEFEIWGVKFNYYGEISSGEPHGFGI